MGLTLNRTGKYSPHDGFVLPAEGFTGRPDIDCPADVCASARMFWATWATSQYAHFFGPTEWLDLHDVTLLMDEFYQTKNGARFTEARHHINNLFGLANRQRLHIDVAAQEQDETEPVSKRNRDDPRLRRAV
jgi:hypothetical protein